MKGLHGGGDTVGEVAICLRKCSVGRGGCHQRQRALVTDVDVEPPRGAPQGGPSRPGIAMPSYQWWLPGLMTAQQGPRPRGQPIRSMIASALSAVRSRLVAAANRLLLLTATPPAMKDLPRPVGGRSCGPVARNSSAARSTAGRSSRAHGPMHDLGPLLGRACARQATVPNTTQPRWRRPVAGRRRHRHPRAGRRRLGVMIRDQRRNRTASRRA